MKIRRYYTYFFLFFLSEVILSCNTFKTYYGTTFQNKNIYKVEKTYRLDLSEQNLTELPEFVNTLKELRMINLSGNENINLEKAFETLSSLPKLEVILLDSIKCKELPDNFKKLNALHHVSLVNNPELNFAQAFELMSGFNLEFLNLSENHLQELPKEINQIKSLRDLKLSSNQLKLSELFFTLSTIPKLRALWIDNNQIELMPFETVMLDKLIYLYLDNNRISEFPPEMKNMNKLLVLHAANNNFEELPIILTQMPQIKFAILSNNPIKSIPQGFDKRNYSLLALIMDGTKLTEGQKKTARIMFKRFFVFSAH